MATHERRSLTLKTLSKSNVWDLQENDIFRMLESSAKDSDMKDNIPHYLNIIKSAFEIEEIGGDRPETARKFEDRGFKVGVMRTEDGKKQRIGIKKRPILRVTDLTYENIRHITATKLMEVLDRNFGGGWESLSQSIQDIILSAFNVSTTTLPKDRLHKKGGMYEKKVGDGYAVLETPKGTWVEAIFAKAKPENERPHQKPYMDGPKGYGDDDTGGGADVSGLAAAFEDNQAEESPFNEEEMLEESYRTTIEPTADDLDISAEDVADEEEYQ